MYLTSLFYLLYSYRKVLLSNLFLGSDERVDFYPDKIFIHNITSKQIFNIHETNEKIKFLESNNNTIDDKLYEIDNRNVPKVFDIYNGGLLNDWEFEFPN